jgi:hypothetical protein
METSTSVAHWRQSRGALKQSWNTTGSFHAYHLTQERPAYRERSRHNPFGYLAAVAYLLPAFVSGSILAPVVAAMALVVLLRPAGARVAFIVSGVLLAFMSPGHDWVFYVATAAMWGTAVALQSRGDKMPNSPVTAAFFQS